MKKTILVVAVVLAALCAWLAWRDEAPPRAADAAPPPTPKTEPERTPPRPRARESDVETKPAMEARPAAPPAPVRPTETLGDEKGGDLLVVDSVTGAPIAGVVVAFLVVQPEPPAAVREALEKEASDPVNVLLRVGRAFTTDAAGKAALPKFDGVAVACARHGDLRGTATLFSRRTQDWRLELHRAAPLSVVVVDAEDRPCAGVSVMLVHVDKDMTYPVLTGETKGDGSVLFPDVADLPACGDGESMSLTVGLPFETPPSASFDPQKPPTETVRLVLPPAGRVRCEVVDDGGGPVPDGQTVCLRRTNAAGVDFEIQGVAGRWNDARAQTSAGVASFQRVGLGLGLEVELASVDETRAASKQSFAGPTSAGEETTVRLKIGAKRPTLVGRLVDERGAPAAGVALVGGLVEPGRNGSAGMEFRRGECTTDADGRFRFAFDRAPGDAAGVKLEIGRNVQSGRGSWSASRVALVDLPAALSAGETDVGDVVFKGGALLCAGVVVDGAGRPLPGASVQAMEVDFRSRSPRRDVDAATADAEGKFRLVGEPSGKKAFVAASLDGFYQPVMAGAAFGATDVRVVMQEAGGLAGSVRIPAGKRGFDIRVVVSGEATNMAGTDYRRGLEGIDEHVGEDGTFSFPSLRPGGARVEFQLGRGHDDTVLVVDGVEIVAGKVTRDPRLQGVDLAKSLGGFAVVVVDPEKKPIPGACVSYLVKGAHAFWKRSEPTGADGRARVDVRPDQLEDGVDVVVTCGGRRSAALSNVAADATVVLAPAKPTTVTVRLAAGSPLPEPPYHLAASLHYLTPGVADDEHEWHGPRDVSNQDRKFDKDRVLTFETFDPGRYRVDLMLWEMDMSGGGGGSVATAPKAVVVTVGEDGAPAEVVVAVDPQDLATRMQRRKPR